MLFDMENKDLYYSKGGVKSYLRRIEKSSIISPKNKSKLNEFYRHLLVSGRSPATIKSVLHLLIKFAELLCKNFEEATVGDIEVVLTRIEEQNNWLESSKWLFIAKVKQFYKWLNGDEEYPKQVKWIKTTRCNNNNKLPTELLTEEEVKKMAEAVDNPRDEAFVLTLYESGCRIGEMLSLKIKNVQDHKHGKVILVNGKTGMRRILLISSAPALSTWLDRHPLKDNTESFLWVSRNYKHSPLSYFLCKKLLKNLAKKAGIKKKANPHAFRHARATHLAKNLTDAQMKHVFGWTQSSKMTAIYVHLSGRDVDSALLKMYGLADQKKDESKLKPKLCIRCKMTNSSTDAFCKKCGTPLDEEAYAKIIDKEMKRSELDKIFDTVIKNEESKEKLLTLMRELTRMANIDSKSEIREGEQIVA